MAVDTPPAKVTVANLVTSKSVEVQYNPDQIKEALETSLTRLAIMGHSHQPLQYQSTNNVKLSFSLGFDTKGDGGTSAMDTLNFLRSLVYVPRGAQDIIGGSIPDVLFTWPNLYTFRCKMTKITTTFTRFDRTLKPSAWVSEIEVEQVSDVRVTMEDVLTNGFRQSTKGAS